MASNVVVPPFDTAPSTVVGASPQSVFPFGFPFWDPADIRVRIGQTYLDPSTFVVEGYFVQNGTPIEGGFGSGRVTLNTPVANVTVVIDRFVVAARETQFSRAAPLAMPSLNADLNKLTARQQDVDRNVQGVAEALPLIQDLPGTVARIDEARDEAIAATTGKLDVTAANIGPESQRAILRSNIGIIEPYATIAYLQRLGFIGDGYEHPLSSVEPTWTLADWQMQFPRAASLDDEIDGLAIQALIDLQLSLPGSTGALVSLPPCSAQCTNAFIHDGLKSVAIVGAGRDVSELYFPAGSQSFFEAGQNTPCGSIRLDGLSVTGSSSAPAIRLDSNAAPSIEMTDVNVFGFSGGGLVGHNITASRFERVIWSTTFGPTIRTNDCYTLTQSRGCFQNFFIDNQILGFRQAHVWHTVTEPGYEGQYVIREQINEGIGAWVTTNSLSAVTGYFAPDWKFTDCEIEVENQVLNFKGMQGVDVNNSYLITLGDQTMLKMHQFEDILDLKLESLSPRIFNGPTQVFAFKNCQAVTARDTKFLHVGFGTATAFHIGTGCSDIVETGSTYAGWPGGPKVTGVTAGHSMETIAFLAGADVDRTGAYTWASSVSAELDATGDLTITFPTKPDGGALFLVPPFITCCNGDAMNGGGESVAPHNVTTTGAKVRFTLGFDAAAQGSTRRANFTVRGPGG